MSVSVKVMIRTDHQRKDGLFPLAIRTIVDRKIHYKTLFPLRPDQFNEQKGEVKRTHPHHLRLNDIIRMKMKSVTDYIYECQIHDIKINIPYFWRGIAIDKATLEAVDQHQLSLHKILLDYLVHLHDQHKYRSAARVNTVMRKVEDYTGDVSVPDMNAGWCEGYELYSRRRGNNNNTIIRDIKVIKAAINRLVRKGTIQYNPIRTYSLEPVRTKKVKLTDEELIILQEMTLTGREDHARDIFLFCLYARGMRVGDAMRLTWSQLRGSILTYSMSKNKKEQRIQLPDRAMEIIRKYRRRSEYIFPILTPTTTLEEEMAQIKTRTTTINTKLKSISRKMGMDKKLSTHIARHTFAAITARRGMDMHLIQRLLDHSSIAITKVYLQDLFSDDELNEVTKGLFD